MTEGRSPLGELYDSVTSANGWSTRDVEARVERLSEGGFSLSKSRISQLVNADPLESITADKINALAIGLGISSARVALAAVQSMGFPIQGDGVTPAEAIARDETLSEDTRRALLSILQAAGRRRGA